MVSIILCPVLGQDSIDQKPDEYVLDLIDLYNGTNTEDGIKAFGYIQKALDYETKIKDENLLKLYRTAGNAHVARQSYYLSINYFYKELELQNKIDPEQSFFIENNIGGAYYYLGDKKKAREFWEKSISGFERYEKNNPGKSHDVEATLVYNNLAVLERKEGNYLKALDMLNEFKKHNIKLRDTLNIIMAYENLSNVYLNLNQNHTALENLYKGVELAKTIKSDYDLASLYGKLGDFYLNHSFSKDSALYYLQHSFEISNANNLMDIKLSSSEKLAAFYEKEKSYGSALQYLHIAKSLSEEAINKENNKKISRLEFEYDQKMEQHQLLLEQKKRERFLYLGLIFLSLFSIIAFLMYKLQKSKAQKRIAENRLLAKKLEEKNRELTNNAIQMIQSSEIIESTHKELTQLKSHTDSSSINKMLSGIISDLKNGSQAFNSKEFEKIFIETDEAFYKKLLGEYPNLTKNEIRLCAFLKMNLSSKEISAITQQSPHSIVVARSRLRKKLGLDNDEQSLTSFLAQF